MEKIFHQIVSHSQVVSLMGPSYNVEEVTRRVEELARLH